MSVKARIYDLFGRSDDPTDGIELIKELLAEREAELTLEAEYGKPYPNMTGRPTVVFPYTLYTTDGDEYGTGSKEFALPDDGLKDSTSPLVSFIKRVHEIQTGEVSVEYLAAVEGTTESAYLDADGDIKLGSVGGDN